MTYNDGEPLRQICFLTYIKSLNKNLIPIGIREHIKPEKVMFCSDAQSIFDSSFGASLRRHTGQSGSDWIDENNVIKLLRTTYWYHKYSRRLGLDSLIIHNIKNYGYKEVWKNIKQTIHTIDGLIIKKMVALGPEMTGYSDIAEDTAYLFRDLFSEYCFPVDYKPRECESLFMEIRELCGFCKTYFHCPTMDKRRQFLEFNFRNKALKRFFTTEFTRLQNFISKQATLGIDYTTSPAWFFRCAELVQTRTMGYLPQIIAAEKSEAYRTTVSRPVEEFEDHHLELIAALVHSELYKAKVPYQLLKREDTKVHPEIKDVLSNIVLDLKGTASKDNLVSEGGKLEDGRLLLRMIYDNSWRIPLRDLETLEITGFLPELIIEDEPDMSRYLFWTSFQLAINWLVVRDLEADSLYFPFLIGEEHYLPDILEAVIVHIQEPGKIRNLVKGTAVMAWTLTPGSKLLQASLALAIEHTAGLNMAAHDWVHTKRIGSESLESDFMFGHDGRTRPEVVHVFKDWTESTDFIAKRIGLTHLQAFMSFIGFPEGYAKIMMKIIREPQPITEVVNYTFDDQVEGCYRVSRAPYKGFLNEGFQMGNPVTKTVLHLIHVSERAFVEAILEKEGINIDRSIGYSSFPRRDNVLPRNLGEQTYRTST